jgi:gas vesicle protein
MKMRYPEARRNVVIGNGNHVGGLVLGLLIGGAAGAAAALLMAPQSGREMRQEMRQRAADAQQRAEKALAQARAMARDEVALGRAILAEGPSQLSHAWRETTHVAITGGREPAEQEDPCATQGVCALG